MQCSRCGFSGNPENSTFCGSCGSQLGQAVPPPTPKPMAGPPALPLCPNCGSPAVERGSIATWAVVAAVLGFFCIGLFSLLFLLVKEPDRCRNCGFALSG